MTAKRESEKGHFYFFSGSDLETATVTINATRTSNPTGRIMAKISPILSANTHMYTEEIIATANQQLDAIAAL